MKFRQSKEEKQKKQVLRQERLARFEAQLAQAAAEQDPVEQLKAYAPIAVLAETYAEVESAMVEGKAQKKSESATAVIALSSIPATILAALAGAGQFSILALPVGIFAALFAQGKIKNKIRNREGQEKSTYIDKLYNQSDAAYERIYEIMDTKWDQLLKAKDALREVLEDSGTLLEIFNRKAAEKALTADPGAGAEADGQTKQGPQGASPNPPKAL